MIAEFMAVERFAYCEECCQCQSRRLGGVDRIMTNGN